MERLCRATCFGFRGSAPGLWPPPGYFETKEMFVVTRIYLDHNATTPLRSEARDAMIAAMDVVGKFRPERGKRLSDFYDSKDHG